MNGTDKLQIPIEHAFDELPRQLTVTQQIIGGDFIRIDDELFDSEETAPASLLSSSSLSVSLYPLIVTPCSESRYVVCDGCKRFLAGRSRGEKSFSCVVVCTELNKFTFGLLRMALNGTRPLSIREKYLFSIWLQKNCAADFHDYAAKIGISRGDITCMHYLSQCSAEVKNAVLNGRIHHTMAEDFSLLSSEDQDRFLHVFEHIQLSLQTQRELFQWLPEIAYRDGIAVKQILTREDVEHILFHKTLNIPQKIQKIRELINSLRFPRLSSAQTIWNKTVQKLNPDSSRIQFIPDPCFEKDKLEVKIVVTNPENAVTIMQKMAEITVSDWKKLIAPTDWYDAKA